MPIINPPLWNGNSFESDLPLIDKSQLQDNEAVNGNNDFYSLDELNNMSTEEYLINMMKNDPDNSSAYIDALTSFKGQKELRNSNLTSIVNQLKENGINPILAYSMMNNSGNSFGGTDVSSLTREKIQASSNQKVSSQNNISNTFKAMIAALALIFAAAL